MLFTKEELGKEVENTEYQEYFKKYPHKTKAANGDKTPFQLIFSNKVRYFDLSSHSVKDLLFKSRKNIAEKCFSSALDQTFPNSKVIEYCIAQNEKEFTDLKIKRETHFGNIMHKYNNDLANCASNDENCKLTVQKELVWNASKLPYFFSENGI